MVASIRSGDTLCHRQFRMVTSDRQMSILQRKAKFNERLSPAEVNQSICTITANAKSVYAV